MLLQRAAHPFTVEEAMSKFKSGRRRKFESLCHMLRRHALKEVQHYVNVAQYPRTLRAAALTVLRERGAI